MEVVYRKAVLEDLSAIVAFVDFWLTGGGKACGIPGAGHDFFVPKGRHEAYLKRYNVLLAGYAGEIVGWAVKTKKGVLIHLLIAATFRGQGIGSEMLRRMSPAVVRSKFDQSSGDPAAFYRKHGFIKAMGERLGKKKNIDIFVKPDGNSSASVEVKKGVWKSNSVPAEGDEDSRNACQRTIDVLAKRLNLRNFPPADDYY